MAMTRMTATRATALVAVALAAALLVASVSAAADLTAGQKAALKADILVRFPGAPNNNDKNDEIATFYNGDAVPVSWAWRASVSPADVMASAGFVWSRIDNMSAGEARIWTLMEALPGLAANKQNVRDGILAAFGQTAGADAPMRLAIFTAFQRPATYAEKLFTPAGGTTTTAQGVGPATLAWEGKLTAGDVEAARQAS